MLANFILSEPDFHGIRQVCEMKQLCSSVEESRQGMAFLTYSSYYNPTFTTK